MEIYLPIVQVHIDIITILFISFAVGVLSGLFGVGGGFLMTPFLIFLGIPPVYAVPNEINNILATSVSGSMTHWFKNTLDYKMGLMIIIGGVIGTVLGIITFTFFKETGKLSLIISLSYMYLLAIIGTLMLIEGAKEIDRARKKLILKQKLHLLDTRLTVETSISKIKTLRKCFYANLTWCYSRVRCSVNRCGRSFFDGTCNDLFNRYASKIYTWNIFICNSFYKCTSNYTTCI